MRRSVSTPVPQGGKQRDCGICGGHYMAGEYRPFHSLDVYHVDAAMKRVAGLLAVAAFLAGDVALYISLTVSAENPGFGLFWMFNAVFGFVAAAMLAAYTVGEIGKAES